MHAMYCSLHYKIILGLLIWCLLQTYAVLILRIKKYDFLNYPFTGLCSFCLYQDRMKSKPKVATTILYSFQLWDANLEQIYICHQPNWKWNCITLTPKCYDHRIQWTWPMIFFKKHHGKCPMGPQWPLFLQLSNDLSFSSITRYIQI